MDIEVVKAANRIEDVIEGDGEELRPGGKYLRGVEHDSLVVDPARGAWFWNSEGRQGDVVDWVQWRQKTDFKGAVEWLCRRAKLEVPRWSGEDVQVAAARRAREDVLTVACRWYVRCLRKSEQGMAYARGRAWADETIQQAGLGYWDGDKQGLGGELDMHGYRDGDPVRRALMGMPVHSLVYPHVEGGRVRYMSTRLASQQKGHWNPPRELVGERLPYPNYAYSPRAELIVIVEGQADAISLGEWGIAAIALAGTSPTSDFSQRVSGARSRFVGLDVDEAGRNGVEGLCDELGPLTRVVAWPEHDVNAWHQAGGTAEECRQLFEQAPLWVEILAQRAGTAESLERPDALRATFTQIARLDEFEVARLREGLAKAMGIGLRPFGQMLKAARGEQVGDEAEEEGELVRVPLPGGYVAEHLLEMLVVPPMSAAEAAAANGAGRRDWETRFAVRYPDGRIGECECLETNGVRYVPMSSFERSLQEGVVQFASSVGEELSLRDLVGRIRGLVHKYVDIDPFYEWMSCYYVIFSWLYDCFQTVPYLRLIGDAGTGKSRFLQVVGPMCYRATSITGASTVSPIFRILDRFRGTLVADEMDQGNSDETAELIKILNVGYQRRQGIVLRSGDKDSGFLPEVFVVYGPKILSTRKRFQDWALESRCLTYETGGPTMREDIPVDIPLSFWREEVPPIRNALLRYRLRYWQPEIELDYSAAEVDSVEPRLRQVTVALLTLIDDEDLRKDLREFIQRYNRQLISERGMTLTAKVLEALVALQALAAGVTLDLPLKAVTDAANILIDVENEGQVVNEDERKGKKLEPRGVGHILRTQLHMQTERGAGGSRAYVVRWDEGRVEALKKRFGLEGEWLEQTVRVLRANWKVEGPPPGM